MANQVNLLPSGRSFSVEDDETMLDAALRQKVDLPYGCRSGICGACKGKVSTGNVELSEHSPDALSAAEKEQGLVLFCCAKLKGDVSIELK